MPKSRARKQQKVRRPIPAPRQGGPGVGRYEPGKLAVKSDLIVATMERAPGESLPLMLLPLMWAKLAEGHQANVCVDACMTLRAAYAQYGIVGELAPVGLAVVDKRTGRSTEYATLRPHWPAPTTFVGHAVLVLPEVGRIIDPTIEQVPPIRRLGQGPLIGKVPAGIVEQLRLGSDIVAVPRGDLLITYMPVVPDCARVLVDSPLPAEHVDGHHRAGTNLATLLLESFRSGIMRDRIRQAPYPRLHALLDAVGDAPIEPDAERNFRIMLPGHPAGVRLDDLDVDGPAAVALPDEQLTSQRDASLPRQPARQSWLSKLRRGAVVGQTGK